jgi:2-dehydropantoate 2-reductase
MRVLIYGAGAIGGYLGALLAGAGVDVTLVARGAQYEALTARGLSVEWGDGRALRVSPPACRPGEIPGSYDLVFVTLKSMQLAAAADDIVSALSPDGSLVMIQNGLPWWYFERVDSPRRGACLPCLDPDGALATGFDLDRVIGGVIYKPVTLQGPGRLFIPAMAGERLIIGEVDNLESARCRRIADIVSQAGLRTEVTTDIRTEKWRKLMVNLVWNPLCTLTQSPSGAIAAWPAGAELARTMMREGHSVARSVGIKLDFDPDAELQRVAGNFSQQPSMLQDLRAGRPLEWDAILTAVIEMAAITGVEVPTLQNIAACVGLLDLRIRTDGVAFAPVPNAQRSTE